MKKILFTLIFLASVTINASAQKITKIVISGKCTIDEAIEKVKEAGIKDKYGSRQIESNVSVGKITLWKTIGGVNSVDFYCSVALTNKDGITTLTFRMPHNPELIANYKKEMKNLVKNLVIPEMMSSEIWQGIE